MRTIGYNECDSFEEVRKLLERLYQEIDEINFVIAPEKAKYQKQLLADAAKVEKEVKAAAAAKIKAEVKAKQLKDAEVVLAKAEASEASAKKRADDQAKAIEDAKKIVNANKRGSVSMKALLMMFIITIVMVFAGSVSGYVASDINYEIAQAPHLLQQYLRDTVGAGTFVFTPIAAPANNDIIEGKMYYDISSKAWFGSTNGTTWTQFEIGSSTVSLDAAYNNGITITVDAGAVVMTASNAADNVVLTLAQSDTGTTKAFTITNAGTGNTLDIQGQSSSNDIEGTDDSWGVSSAGIFDGEGLTGVTNSQGILFDEDNEIQFGDNSEDVAMVFSANTLTWATDTGVDSFAFGVVDDLEGVGTIVFDAAASTITLTADAGTEDLTISQAGAVDASLILSSAGTSTTDALIVNTDTGSIKINSADNLDIDAADNITIDTAGGSLIATTIGGDITLDASDSSVIIRGTEEAADAIVIDADGTAGGITVDYGTGNMVITGTGASADFTLDADLISIDGTGVSNITCTNGANEDFTISTAGAADHSLILTATGTASDGFQITNSAGGIDFSSATTMDIDSTGAFTLNQAGDTLTIQLDSDGAGDDLSLIVDGDDDASIVLNCDGTAANAIDIDTSAGGIDIDIAGAAAGEDFAVTTNSSITLVASEAVADQFKVDATGAVAGNAINLETTNGGILLNADGANGDIGIDGNASVTITTAGDLALAVTGNVTGAILGDGSDILQGYLAGVEIEAGTTEQLLVADSGKVFVNSNAGTTTFTLPDAAAGLIYYFVDNDNTGAADVVIDPQVGDNIDHDTNGDAIESVTDAYPQTIILVALNGTDWATIGTNGTWGQQ